ncbi:unnamed protein product [Adineta ricciae]|uniref:Uncharacterized protein n=1 Tax=Adineta ricciae TaxID=249248 RepID=A0A815K4K1_ADIRI|nr:unnamed protein product [Adineta ricciae]CAF1388457.1 unnamed protein product [Adineta ricciae]
MSSNFGARISYTVNSLGSQTTTMISPTTPVTSIKIFNSTNTALASSTSTVIIPAVQSNYSSALTMASPLYSRPDNPWDGSVFFYEVIQLRVTMTGVYIILSNSTIDMEGYLYNNTFNWSFPYANILAKDGNAAGDGQFMLSVMLSSMKNYTLAVSTYWARTTGAFSIIASGPSAVAFSLIPPLPYTQSNYSSALTMASPLYSRPDNPWDGSVFFYEVIQLRVTMTGVYIILSNSAINMEGYLYNNTFNWSFPYANLLAEDNDAAGDGQFMLSVMLSSIKNYTLVVSTYWAWTTGEFSITIYGPQTTSISSTNSTKIQSQYASALTLLSPKFNHSTITESTGISYYQAILISVDISGGYSIASNSSMDTLGYLYNTTFNSTKPKENLIDSNDDDGGNRQFMFIVMLHSGINYTVVIATYSEDVIGSYDILAEGPGTMSFISL